MNVSARRFLVLNAALNGHNFLDVYNGDVDFAAQDLGVTPAQVRQWVERFQKNCTYPTLAESCQPEFTVLLNFYRCNEYAFVFIPGFGQLTLSAFAETDRNGDVDDRTRQQVLSMLVRDIAIVNDDSEVRIADGVFYVNGHGKNSVPPTTLLQYMLSAYILYRDGPFTGNEKASELIFSLRDQFTLEGYKNFTAKQCVGVLKDLAYYPGNPTDFRDSLLRICDLLPVYQATGGILQDNSGEVLWLLDVKGTSRCKVEEVSYTAVRGLIIQSLRDLANVVWSEKEGLTIDCGSDGNA